MDLLAAGEAHKLVLAINKTIVNPAIILMFTFALVAFLWGVQSYISGADNEEARLKGAQHMLWGIIGMSIMVMSFAIVRIVIQTFGIDKDTRTMESIDKVLRR